MTRQTAQHIASDLGNQMALKLINRNISTLAIAMLCGLASLAEANITYSLATPEASLANWAYGAAMTTVKTYSNLDPSGKRVDLGHSADSDGENLRMAQTFQVANTFTMDSISLLVWNVMPNVTIHFRIFSVSDVTSSISYPLNPANVLLSGNYVYNDVSPLYAQRILTINLTGAEQATLAATSGNAGYAFELSVDSVTTAGAIQWEATIANTVAGLPLKYDQSGTSGVYNTGRDYSLAITAAAVPEPISLAILSGLGFAALQTRKRR